MLLMHKGSSGLVFSSLLLRLYSCSLVWTSEYEPIYFYYTCFLKDFEGSDKILILQLENKCNGGRACQLCNKWQTHWNRLDKKYWNMWIGRTWSQVWHFLSTLSQIIILTVVHIILEDLDLLAKVFIWHT